MLINTTPWSYTKKMPYKIVYSRNYTIFETSSRYCVVATAKHLYAKCWRLYLGAISNMVRTMTETASLSGEGQSRPFGKIFRYPRS